MAGNTSNVGGPATYEAGDQRNYAQDEIKGADKFNEGRANAHMPNDSKDERTIANKLEREEEREKREKHEEKTYEDKIRKEDATAPAKMHGNEPSKGAKIDEQIRQEEEEMLKKKGNFGPKAAN